MDSKKLLEIKQERANITNSIRDIMNEFDSKEMPGEKKDELAKLEAKFDTLNAQILAEEKQIERERIIGEKNPEPGAPKDTQATMFAKALSGDPNHVEAYRNSYTLGADATAGALTAPMEFVQELIKGLDDQLFMRQISKVVGPIGPAQSLGFPYRSVDAGTPLWTAEVTTAGEESTLEYGRREFKPNKLCRLIKLSRTLVEHAPMAESIVRDEILYRIGIAAENSYMTGDGSSKPLGIFIANENGIDTDRDISTGNTTTAVTFDGLINAKYSVKGQYHNGAAWIGHRDLAKMLAKIKDGEGRYVWQGSVVTGQPDTLLGAPFYMSEYAPNTFATGKYVAVYGNFKAGYWICDANSVRVQVLRELYAPTNQIGYLVDYFGDGAPVLPEAFARVKLA